MSVVGDGTERGDGGVDEPGWEVDPDDEPGAVVVAAVGRQIKAWREAAGMRAAEFGTAMGYSEDLIYKVEGAAGASLARSSWTVRTGCWGRAGSSRR
ncbi:hypothetical protein SMICM304S_01972 [Streptomyces microflavus]